MNANGLTDEKFLSKLSSNEFGNLVPFGSARDGINKLEEGVLTA